MTTIPLTPYRRHVERWKDCTKCTLHETRCKVVFPRGQVPCDVLFVAEAPGESENVVGKPLIGPAGKLFDQIVERALGHLDPLPRVAFTNLLLCIPYDPDGTGKVDEPDAEWIEACRPRLEEFVGIACPKLVVAVGAYARDWLTQGTMGCMELPRGVRVIDVTHPAAILRMSDAQRGLAAKRVEIQIRNAMEAL